MIHEPVHGLRGVIGHPLLGLLCGCLERSAIDTTCRLIDCLSCAVVQSESTEGRPATVDPPELGPTTMMPRPPTAKKVVCARIEPLLN